MRTRAGNAILLAAALWLPPGHVLAAPAAEPPDQPEPDTTRTRASEMMLELNFPISSRNVTFGVKYAAHTLRKSRGRRGYGLAGSLSLGTDFLLRGFNGGFMLEDVYNPTLAMSARGGLLVTPRPRKRVKPPLDLTYVFGIGLRGSIEPDGLLNPSAETADVYFGADIAFYGAVSTKDVGLTFTIRPIAGGLHLEPQVTRILEPRLGNVLLEIDVSIPLVTLWSYVSGGTAPQLEAGSSASQ